MEDKGSRPRFFQETFLMVDTKIEVILEMPFLKISNANMAFGKKTLMWKSYITNKALPITEQVQLINLKEFVIAVLDADNKTFMMHIVIREQKQMLVHFEKQVQVRAPLFNKAPIEVPVEYSNYSNVFSAENVAELSENTGMNQHAIKLKKGKQPPFGLIYSLGLVELEMLKTYIETNLANSFIRPSKFSVNAPVLFDWKPDENLRLCVNYRGLNNITIKNQYLLSLIDELLDQLNRARRFTQLDLTIAYHWMRICKGNEWKTVFWTRYGHFKYQVIFLGLSNTPATFQRYVNKILAEKLNIFVIIYLNNILI